MSLEHELGSIWYSPHCEADILGILATAGLLLRLSERRASFHTGGLGWHSLLANLAVFVPFRSDRRRMATSLPDLPTIACAFTLYSMCSSCAARAQKMCLRFALLEAACCGKEEGRHLAVRARWSLTSLVSHVAPHLTPVSQPPSPPDPATTPPPGSSEQAARGRSRRKPAPPLRRAQTSAMDTTAPGGRRGFETAPRASVDICGGRSGRRIAPGVH